jgi:hypothetical protein
MPGSSFVVIVLVALGTFFLLGRYFTTGAMTLAFSALVIFEIGFQFPTPSQPVLTNVARMTGMSYHAQLLVEMGSLKFFARAGLKLRSSQSLPSE